MTLEQAAAMCGLAPDDLRGRVAAKTFPLPRSCGGERWHYGELRDWCRTNGVTPPPFSGAFHESDVCKRLNCSPRTLYELIRREQFPAPIGATRRWDVERVNNWFALGGERRTLAVRAR